MVRRQLRPERAEHAFADLAAYYVAWLKTGSAPAILRDRLLYVHRTQPTTATPDLAKQDGGVFQCKDATPATDEVELGGSVTRKDVAAGLGSMRIALAPGKPVFRLVRNQTTVISVQSDWSISDAVVYQDLLYRGGGSPRCD